MSQKWGSKMNSETHQEMQLDWPESGPVFLEKMTENGEKPGRKTLIMIMNFFAWGARFCPGFLGGWLAAHPRQPPTHFNPRRLPRSACHPTPKKYMIAASRTHTPKKPYATLSGKLLAFA